MAENQAAKATRAASLAARGADDFLWFIRESLGELPHPDPYFPGCPWSRDFLWEAARKLVELGQDGGFPGESRAEAPQLGPDPAIVERVVTDYMGRFNGGLARMGLRPSLEARHWIREEVERSVRMALALAAKGA